MNDVDPDFSVYLKCICGFSIPSLRFNPRPLHVGFMVEKVGLGQV